MPFGTCGRILTRKCCGPVTVLDVDVRKGWWRLVWNSMESSGRAATLRKRPNMTPEQFRDYDEAAEFWEAHDTTDYLDEFRTVDVKGEWRERQFEVELEEDVVKALQRKAREQGLSVSDLASTLLRQKLNEAPASRPPRCQR